MRLSHNRILAADPVAHRGGRAAALVAEPVELAAAVVARGADKEALVAAADSVRAAAVDLVAGDRRPSRLLPIRFH